MGESARGDTVAAGTSGAAVASGLGVRRALQAVREAPTVLEGLRRVDAVVRAAALDDGSSEATLRDAAGDATDQVTAVAAVHALGALPDGAGGEALLALLRNGSAHLREHAAWAFASRPPVTDAVEPLVGLLARGGFAGMLAQRTLERWGRPEPDAVWSPLARALTTATDPAHRALLVETLGLVPGPDPAMLIERAQDPAEAPAARAAAVAALGDQHPDAAVLQALRSLARGDGPLADTARTALHDLQPTARHPGPSPAPRRAGRDGLSVLQLFLHADIDAELTHAGQGDNGGIATLLVQLGDVLVDDGRATSRVTTLSRGGPADATKGLADLVRPGHHYASVPLWGPPVHAADAWPLRVATRRAVRRVLRAAHPVDVVHLRMADVGSLAAAEAAAALGIPTVLTVAPDPHALVHAREQAGTLHRGNLAEADLLEHLVFRDRLLRHLADEAAHLVLFPRPALRDDLHTLLGIDLDRPARPCTVVAEGVDFAGTDRAAALVAGAARPGAALPPELADLDALLGRLPTGRRHLPVALTVGRLHRVKGMAALVRAWAGSPELSARCNLVIVGGDLEAPNDDEAAELAGIASQVAAEDAARRGLLLAGHRPNPVVKAWMAAVRRGRPGLCAGNGVYVAASLKEEFGIAILEALASGLVVVAPTAGGPATYVERGVTGLLVDTSSPEAVADAVHRALELAADPLAVRRADAARARVRERLGIGAMASALDEVYRQVSAASSAEPRPSTPGAVVGRGTSTPFGAAS